MQRRSPRSDVLFTPRLLPTASGRCRSWSGRSARRRCSSSASIKRIIGARRPAFQLGVVVRNHGHAGRTGRDAGLLHRFQHAFIGGRSQSGFPSFRHRHRFIFAARLEDDVHQIVFLGRRLGNDDVALLVEHLRDRTGCGHVSAVLAEGVTDFADRAIAVVG